MLFITFLLNYFRTIICVFNLYILEINFPWTFPDVTVTVMPVTNCIYNFFILIWLWLSLNFTANLQNKNMRCLNSISA